MYRKVLSFLTVCTVLLGFLPAAPVTLADQAATERVSVSSFGEQGQAVSENPSISADGRYVAFQSEAANLVPGDTNGARDVFVRDRLTGTTERVSVSSTGAQGNGTSDRPSISADGRYVAFASAAANLVPGDTNGKFDVFIHDRFTDTTERVSVSTNGQQADGGSAGHSISGDGRYVAFVSWATNLVSNDTNGAQDVFVRDRLAGTTERVSVSSDGKQTTIGGYGSNAPSISADGRYVAFTSQDSRLVEDDPNWVSDVFVRDRQAGTTERVSVFGAGGEGGGGSESPAISADGRYVTFVSWPANGTSDVFVRDRQAGATERVSVSSASGQGDGASWAPSISADGRYVAFASAAANLTPGDTNGVEDVFVRDRQMGTTERVSASGAGAQGNGTSNAPSVSADGRYVAFRSLASNLVPGDTNAVSDVFVHQAQTLSGRIEVEGKVGGTGFTERSPLTWVEVEADLFAAGGRRGTITAHTDLRGDYSFVVPGGVDQVALRVRLRDEHGLIEVRDAGGASPGIAAWLATPRFNFTGTRRQNLLLDVNDNDAVAYRWSTTGLPTDASATFLPAASNAGVYKQTNRFGHLSFHYHYTLLAARFARERLGLELDHNLPVKVISWSATGTSYFPDTATIHINERSSPLGETQGRNRPDNVEFHEFAHHIMADSSIGGENQLPPWLPGELNHNGLCNRTSGDSWVEGFGEFLSMVISTEMLGRHDAHLYRVWGTFNNYQFPYRLYRGDDPATPQREVRLYPIEENTVASLLWDLYDDDAPEDPVHLGIQEIWQVFTANGPALFDFKAVRDALAASGRVSAADLERLFAERDLYNDRPAGGGNWTLDNTDYQCLMGGTFRTREGDGIRQGGEEIGRTSWNQAFTDRPMQPVLAGSTVSFDAVDAQTGKAIPDVTFRVSLEHDAPHAAHDRSYTYTAAGTPPFRFPIYLPPVPSRAVVVAEKAGYRVSAPLVIDSDDYLDSLLAGKGFLAEHTFRLTARTGASPSVRIVLTVGSKRATVNGAGRDLPVAPRIVDGRTFVPLRFVGEAMGAEIGWDGATRRVTYRLPPRMVELWIDQKLARVDGTEVTLDVAPFISDGSTLVPVRFVAEQLGAQVDWDGAKRRVTVTFPPPGG